MKRFVAISFLSAFLVACGGNDTQKFIGEWIDPDPTPAKRSGLYYSPAVNNSISIKAAEGNEVFVTYELYDKKSTLTATVVKDSVVNKTGKVLFEFTDGKLKHLAANKLLHKEP